MLKSTQAYSRLTALTTVRQFLVSCIATVWYSCILKWHVLWQDMCLNRPGHNWVWGEKPKKVSKLLYMYTKCCMRVWNWACGCVFCLCCMHSLNPLLKLDTAQYRHRCYSSQVTLLPLSPLPPPTSLPIFFFFLPSRHFICSPSPFSSFLLPLSLLALPPVFFWTPPHPPSAFDDLSQAHGEYSKGGYGGSAQSQAKSAGSGPGKGTHTKPVRTL